MINPNNVINLRKEFNKNHGTNYTAEDLIGKYAHLYYPWLYQFITNKYKEWGYNDEREDH